jgi:hypothetical protein
MDQALLQKLLAEKMKQKEATRDRVMADDYMDDADKYMRLANQPTEEELTDEYFEKMDDEAYLRSPEGKAAQAKKARIEALKMLRDGKY